MIQIRKSKDRGEVFHGWLHSFHTFSFGQYYDPKHMEFGALRVINEDFIDANQGFGKHPHSNMEIITYILEGELEHKDSLGTGSIISVGDVQRMSAGTGIIHSEFNPNENKKVHLLQIWIVPNKQGIPPSYEQKNFAEKRRQNQLNGQLTLLASQNGRDESLTIHQDAELYVLDLDKNQKFSYNIKSDQMIWIQMTKGSVNMNNENLNQGDGARIIDEEKLEFFAKEKTEILIFNFKKI